MPDNDNEKIDYSKTLNLPEADKKNADGIDTNDSAIPLRANLPKREPILLKFWDENDIYHKSLQGKTAQGTFILHDGPPYSNGDVHVGTALGKILKDFIVKYKTMQGYQAPYVPGWDNHGLPIENNVRREFLEKKQQPTVLEIRRRCREYAAHWVETQKAQFRRLGVRGDWDNPYLTMSSDFEAAIVEVFRELVVGGYVYRGVKPVYWCPVDETALADHEVEYAQKTDPSIYVRFKLKADPNKVFAGFDSAHCYSVIWTTTPWTIPANVALAVHPSFTYAVVSQGADRYLLARDLVEIVMNAAGLADWKIEWEIDGKDLKGLVFQHPLYDRESPVVLADYVTLDEGSGIVHTAPGHGQEDYQTGIKYNLPVLSPVDSRGRFTEEVGPQFAGQKIWEGNKTVAEALKSAGALMALGEISHSYPHCWRCHKPVIFRATAQWFMNIDHKNLRAKCLHDIEGVSWYPKQSINRIKAMVGGSPDWCLSRQRAWGVGIPVFYCKECNTEVMTSETIARVRDLVAEFSSDVWFERSAKELLPEGYKCHKCGAAEFEKETDIFDVWFDSGATNRAVLENSKWPMLRWPADVYLEGGDQHRGWFNSSLKLAEATKGHAPYRNVITSGWTVDEHGKAMHKSAGNAVAADQVIQTDGAEVLRLWVGSADYFEEMRIGPAILDQVKIMYRQFRNTLRWGLGNLYDFDPVLNAVPLDKMREIDRFALHRLAELVAESQRAYDGYEFHRCTHAAHQFCATDLSAFYYDVLKDCLYADGADWPSRRSAQTALFEITSTLSRMLAPILSFTSEEVWQKLRMPNKPFSVELAAFPTHRAEFVDTELAERWNKLLAIRAEANKAIEEARQSKQIGKPLEAKMEIEANITNYRILKDYLEELPSLLLVSQVSLSEHDGPTKFTVLPAEGRKCDRCWLIKTDVEEKTHLCGRCTAVVNNLPANGA
jgi:isoleucyl-tRNA synthetase